MHHNIHALVCVNHTPAACCTAVLVLYFSILQTSEAIDVYSFGHLLYEMVFGRALNLPTIAHLDANVPPMISELLYYVAVQLTKYNVFNNLQGLQRFQQAGGKTSAPNLFSSRCCFKTQVGAFD